MRDEALMEPARSMAEDLLRNHPQQVEPLIRRWLKGGENYADI